MDQRPPRTGDPEPGDRRAARSARREERSELGVRGGLRGIAVVVLVATALAGGAWLLANSMAWLVATVSWC